MKKKVSIVLIISLLLDQITKLLIDKFLVDEQIIPIIKNFFSLTKVSNIGAAFSILEGNVPFLIIASLIAMIILYKYIQYFKENRLTILSFGLIFGGIIGNLIDRCFLGYVRDFLKFDIFGYNYPIFNIADSCIVVGVILLIVCMLRGDDTSVSKSVRRRK